MNTKLPNKLDGTEKTFSAISAYVSASRSIFNSKSLQSMIQATCIGITKQPPYVLACVGLIQEGKKLINIIDYQGQAKNYAKDLVLSWDEHETSGQGPSGVAIREGRSIAIQDMEQAHQFTPWVGKARENGLRSSLSIPLFDNGTLIGIFIIYSSELNTFNSEVVKLFEMLGEDITYGISVIRKIDNFNKML